MTASTRLFPLPCYTRTGCVQIGVEDGSPSRILDRHISVVEPVDECLSPEFGQLSTVVDAEEPLYGVPRNRRVGEPVRRGRERRPSLRDGLEVAEEPLLERRGAGFLVRREPVDEEGEPVGLRSVVVDPVTDHRVDPRDVDTYRAGVNAATTAGTQIVELGGDVEPLDSSLPTGRDPPPE